MHDLFLSSVFSSSSWAGKAGDADRGTGNCLYNCLMLVVPVWRYYELLPALSHLIHGTITFPARLCVALPFVMDQEEAVGCLEEMARKRKERLEALKKSASSAPDGDGTSEDSSLPA